MRRVVKRWMRMLGMWLVALGLRVWESSGSGGAQQCNSCSAPVCVSCGLHSRAVANGATYCSSECERVKPERRRTTRMYGGVVGETRELTG